MTDVLRKKLSRRDAIKLLGAAAGATMLANIPSKWSKPSLMSGVLPAHAQTSICWAVFVEVLDTDGFLGGGSDPQPDQYLAFPSPFGWYCQSGCLFIEFSMPEGTTFVDIRVTTISETFEVNLTENNPTVYLLIDMETGATAFNGGTPPGDCEWPIV